MKSQSTEQATKGDVIVFTIILFVVMTIYYVDLALKIRDTPSRCVPAESK